MTCVMCHWQLVEGRHGHESVIGEEQPVPNPFGKAISRRDVFIFGNSPLCQALCVGQKRGRYWTKRSALSNVGGDCCVGKYSFCDIENQGHVQCVIGSPSKCDTDMGSVIGRPVRGGITILPILKY